IRGTQILLRVRAGDDDRAGRGDDGPELRDGLETRLDGYLDGRDPAVAAGDGVLRLPAAAEHHDAAAGARRRGAGGRRIDGPDPDRPDRAEHQADDRGDHDPVVPRGVEPVFVATVDPERLRIQDAGDGDAVLHGEPGGGADVGADDGDGDDCGLAT